MDWERLGYWNCHSPGPDTLANPWHPLFSFLDPTSRQPRWPTMTPAFHELLRPVFRLATGMLQSPASLAFLHELIYGQRTELVESRLEGFPYYEMRRSNLPFPPSEDPHFTLIRLVPHVRWFTGDSNERIPEVQARTDVTGAPCSIVVNTSTPTARLSEQHPPSAQPAGRPDT